VRRACASASAVVVATIALCACGPAASEGGADGATAPDSFGLVFETNEGSFEVEFVRAWSPVAVDRVWQLGQAGFWEGARIYRVNDRYAQFGYSGRPELDARWVPAGLPDEPVQASNERGTVSFARGGPGTRSAILFVNRSDNTNLDDLQWNGVLGFPPVGRVVSGMDVIDALHDGYGDAPMQWEDSIATQGNPFLDRMYPDLDSITGLRVTTSGG
jgi:cyclophilin family peptidyl-prolyl cis-trans isomerase